MDGGNAGGLSGTIPALQSDAGDDPHRPATGPAGLDVDAEYALQALRLRYCAFHRSKLYYCRFRDLFFVTFRAQRNRSINTQETLGVYGFLGAFGLWNLISIIMGI